MRRPAGTRRPQVPATSPEYTKQLVSWLQAFLKTKDEKHAAAVSGAGPTAKEVILRRLAANGSLEPRRATGRPPTYSDKVMERAVELLAEDPSAQLTLKDLLAKLVAEGSAPAGSEYTGNFSARFRQYCTAHHLHVNTTSRSTKFMLATKDHKPRVEFCRAQLPLLKGAALANIWFSDETTIEESPHPKGTCSVTAAWHV